MRQRSRDRRATRQAKARDRWPARPEYSPSAGIKKGRNPRQDWPCLPPSKSVLLEPSREGLPALPE